MQQFYAGIGARDTPGEIFMRMHTAAAWLAIGGFVLRSGGAGGADTAFERGCGTVNGLGEIFYANREIRNSWYHVAEQFHPAWNRCSNYAKRLHARNTPIVLGADLLHPVRFVLCWTAGGKITGGTGQALRIAKGHDIPVFNLFNPPALGDLETYLGIRLQ